MTRHQSEFHFFSPFRENILSSPNPPGLSFIRFIFFGIGFDFNNEIGFWGILHDFLSFFFSFLVGGRWMRYSVLTMRCDLQEV